MSPIVKTIAEALERYHLSFQSEREFQEQFERMLEFEHIPFLREHVLTPKDRPDFFVQNIAIDLKLGGSVNAHLRQLKRYADHPAVDETVLVATRPMPVPDTLSGKPCTCLSVWKQRL